jgi:hypothetical protein
MKIANGILFLLICATISIAQTPIKQRQLSQQAPAKKKTTSNSPNKVEPKMISISVNTDTRCLLFVDGKMQDDYVEVTKPSTIFLSKAMHKLTAKPSLTSLDKWEASIDTAAADAKTEIKIELIPIRIKRIKEDKTKESKSTTDFIKSELNRNYVLALSRLSEADRADFERAANGIGAPYGANAEELRKTIKCVYMNYQQILLNKHEGQRSVDNRDPINKAVTQSLKNWFNANDIENLTADEMQSDDIKRADALVDVLYVGWGQYQSSFLDTNEHVFMLQIAIQATHKGGIIYKATLAQPLTSQNLEIFLEKNGTVVPGAVSKVIDSDLPAIR